MDIRGAAVFIVVSTLGPLAQAQTHVSGTVECPKPDKQFSLPVEGEADHVYAISRGACHWTKPMEIGGSKTKADVVTNYDEAHGASAKGHGDSVGTLENGDQFHVRLRGKSVLKDGAPVSSEGKWKFESGTGALKGVKGGGTYTCQASAGGSMACEVVGDYTLNK